MPISTDIKVVILAAVLVIVGVIVLAFVLDRGILASQGVGLIGSILAVPESIGNGIANAITGFFNYIAHLFSNLFIIY